MVAKAAFLSCWGPAISWCVMLVSGCVTVDGRNPANHLFSIKPYKNYSRIFSISAGDRRISEPSTESSEKNIRKCHPAHQLAHLSNLLKSWTQGTHDQANIWMEEYSTNQDGTTIEAMM